MATPSRDTDADGRPWFTQEERLDCLQEALERVVWCYDNYTAARDPISQADWLMKLNDALFDASTWLPNFDPEQGRVVWEGDEE